MACLLRSWSRPWSPFRSGGGCSSLSGDLRSLFLRPREAVSHGLGLSVARDERVVIPVPPQRSWSLLSGNSVDFLFIHKLPRISLDILTYWSFKNVPWLALEPFDLGVSYAHSEIFQYLFEAFTLLSSTSTSVRQNVAAQSRLPGLTVVPGEVSSVRPLTDPPPATSFPVVQPSSRVFT